MQFDFSFYLYLTFTPQGTPKLFPLWIIKPLIPVFFKKVHVRKMLPRFTHKTIRLILACTVYALKGIFTRRRSNASIVGATDSCKMDQNYTGQLPAKARYRPVNTPSKSLTCVRIFISGRNVDSHHRLFPNHSMMYICWFKPWNCWSWHDLNKCRRDGYTFFVACSCVLWRPLLNLWLWSWDLEN